MGDTRLVFLGIQAHLDRYAKDNNFSQHTMAALIYRKIEDYWMPIMDSASTVSAILDPRSKLSVFPHESRSSARAHIQSIYELYKERFFSLTNPAPPTLVRKNNRQFFAQLRQTDENEVSTPEPETETEINHYFEQPVDEEVEPLYWWQAHSKEFSILSKMARDYLTIQATSVASESAFSIAGNAITKTRNRLLPETTRACLCVKSWMDKGLVKV